MKLKCYDKYNKQHLIIDFDNDGADDRIDCDSSSSARASGRVYLNFLIDADYYRAHPIVYVEDPHPERWSDLTDFEIV